MKNLIGVYVPGIQNKAQHLETAQCQRVGPGCSAFRFHLGKGITLNQSGDLGIQTVSSCCPSEPPTPRELSEAQGSGT